VKSTTINRLDALEARARMGEPPRGALGPFARFQLCALAVLAGGATAHESIADGVARALGYSSTREFRAASTGKADGRPKERDDFDGRWTRAVHELCRANGLDAKQTTVADFINMVAPLIPLAPDSQARSQALEMLTGWPDYIEAADNG
jgi:hypothetical protein